MSARFWTCAEIYIYISAAVSILATLHHNKHLLRISLIRIFEMNVVLKLLAYSDAMDTSVFRPCLAQSYHLWRLHNLLYWIPLH